MNLKEKITFQPRLKTPRKDQLKSIFTSSY
jgi:hypothetical protein